MDLPNDLPPAAPVPPAAQPPPSFAPPPRKKQGFSTSLLFALGCGGFLLLAVVGVGVSVAVSGGSTSVEDGAILKLSLHGAIPEFVEETGLEALLGDSPVSVAQHLSNLKKAAADKRVKGVLLKIEPVHAGWAKVEELRDALVEFKKSGKFVIAYGEMMDEKAYALALAADEIVMPKDAPFEFNGLSMDIAHYPGLLEKVGIDVQYFRYGKYKSASGEQMGRKAFTEPVKEMLETNLDQIFGHFVDAVALYRKLKPEDVRALIDEGHLKSDWALEHKLIDTLAYWDEVEDALRKRTNVAPGKPLHWLSASKYRHVSGSEAGLPKPQHTFALIYSQGLIVAGKGGGSDPFGGGNTQGATPIITALRKAADDEKVKAIIFRVDSPGGAGLGCDYVRREVEKAKAKKPVIVSMSDVAASGGYWVSMDATGIVAQPTTATGSIGIFSVIPSLGGLYEKLALNNEIFKRGAHADAIVGARKMTDEEALSFDTDLHASYLRFVSLAAHGRGMKDDAMQELAQGRTWYGTQAKENGLIDRLGGFPAAIALAKEKAGLKPEDTVGLELFHDKKSPLEALLGRDKDEDDEEERVAPAAAFTQALLAPLLKDPAVQALTQKVPLLAPFARQVVAGETVFPMAEFEVDAH